MGWTSESRALDAVLGADVNPASEFNTNLFMSRNQAVNIGKDVWGEGIDGGLDLVLSDSRWKINANSRFQNRWYQDDNNLDYFNQLFSVKSQYYFSERAILGMDAQYNMDNTLSTENVADLGYVFTRIPRTTRSISPNWSYVLTEKSRLSLAYTYQDTNYDQQRNLNNVVDSAAHIGSLNLSHQWNEKLQLLGSLNYTSYDLFGRDFESSVRAYPFPFLNGFIVTPATVFIPGVTTTIRTASFMAGFSYNPTESVTLAFSGGGQHNQTTSPENREPITSTVFPFLTDTINSRRISSSSFSEILTASARKKFERSDIGFNYSLSLSPNLQGLLTSYERYNFTGNYKFTPQLSSSLNISLSDQTGSAQASREIFSVRPGINWQWDQNWVLNASYQYTRIDFAASGNLSASSPDSHALYLNIRYLFDKHQF